MGGTNERVGMDTAKGGEKVIKWKVCKVKS
jgi:hypothetical protein